MFDENPIIAEWKHSDRKARERLSNILTLGLTETQRLATISDISFMPMHQVMEYLERADKLQGV